VIVLFVFCVPSVLSTARGEEPIRLVTGEDLPPFASPTWPEGGVITEIVVKSLVRSGLTVAPVVFLPWARGYRDVRESRMDATFPYVHTPEREAEMVFSGNIYDSPSMALFAADSGRDYTGPDSVKGLTLCLPIGNASPLQFLIDKGEVSVTMRPAEYEDCLRAVAGHRVDFLTANETILLPIMRDTGRWESIHIGSVPVQVRPTYLIVAKSNPRADLIVARFNAGLAALRESGEYDRIFERHFGAARMKPPLG